MMPGGASVDIPAPGSAGMSTEATAAAATNSTVIFCLR